MLSWVQPFAAPWTAAHRAPLSFATFFTTDSLINWKAWASPYSSLVSVMPEIAGQQDCQQLFPTLAS